MTRLPLTQRPLDLIYFIFFLVRNRCIRSPRPLIIPQVHIPATICMDLQRFYPPALVPQPLKDFLTWYLDMTNDPVVSGALGLRGAPGDFAWIKSFFALEGYVFCISALRQGLIRG
jgi:hypothetical protein